MKKLFSKMVLVATLMVSSVANAGLIKDLDLNNATVGSTIEMMSPGTAIDALGDFDFLIPVYLKSGTGYFSDLTDVIGYTTYKLGDIQVVGTLYDFSSIITELSGWDLSLDIVTGSTTGNVTDIFGLAELSNGSSSVKFDVTGTHTAYYDTKGFTNAGIESMLTVIDSSIPSTSVPEPSSLAIFALAMFGLVNRKKFTVK